MADIRKERKGSRVLFVPVSEEGRLYLRRIFELRFGATLDVDTEFGDEVEKMIQEAKLSLD